MLRLLQSSNPQCLIYKGFVMPEGGTTSNALRPRPVVQGGLPEQDSGGWWS